MITTVFLDRVTEFIDHQVAKVVLNEVHEITTFELKQAADQTFSMKYFVPNGLFERITKIELKDAANRVISTNQVDVPITSDTVMLQSIKVREG